MDSFIGPPGYWDYNPLLYPYHSCEYLPPILDLEFGPFGAAPGPRNQSRRSRTKQKPYAEESDIIFKGRRLWTYYLEKVPYAMEKPTNEDFNETYRQTLDGRTLKYTLTVLQQPERARACGAGARSSADRRPVDPPPVIELRVYEGQGSDTKDWTDITLKHNATFILCASLENARPIARGRLHSPANIASLQGVNFAGTNYLERPKPAGYFIFPDLSVRNEGWYRLSFSLLEGTKDARDADPERQFPPSPRPKTDGEPKAPLNFEDMATRLDVRSRPFQVFSAKKFPGLSESTELSRLVADQGCRVRIRRDVRMRKHGARKDDGDSYEGERRSMSRFQTPDTAYQPQTPMERPRSISRASMEGSQHSYDHYRRASGEMSYYGQGYRPGQMSHGSVGPSPIAAYPAPPPPPSMSATVSALSHVGYAHIAAPTPLNGFAVPQLRHPTDSIVPGCPALESRPSCYSLPNSAAVPRPITPDISRPSLPAPAISNLLNQTNESTTYDRKRFARSGEPGPAKRCFSPNTSDAQFQPLKGGRRPDSLQGVSSHASSGTMEPDNSPYNSDSEDGAEGSLAGSMKYKRANGTTGRKPIPLSTNNSQGRM